MSVAMDSRCHSVSVGEETICAVLTVPENGDTRRLAVMAHGGPGGGKEGPADLYLDLAGILARRGIASVRFDFLGSGESTGSYRDMTITGQTREMQAVVDAMQSLLQPSSTALIGESYGATIAIRGLRQARYSALVLLWPAIWLLDNTFESYVTEEKLTLARRQGYIEEEGQEVGLAFLEQVLEIGDVSSHLRGVGVPTLFVHGDADQEVPYQQSHRASELLAGVNRVVIVPGGDHCLERPAERETVYRETAEWLVAHV